MSKITTMIESKMAKTTTEMYAISLMLQSTGLERGPDTRLLLGITVEKRGR